MCYVASMAVLYACLGIFQLQLVVPQSPVDPGYTCIGLGIFRIYTKCLAGIFSMCHIDRFIDSGAFHVIVAGRWPSCGDTFFLPRHIFVASRHVLRHLEDF